MYGNDGLYFTRIDRVIKEGLVLYPSIHGSIEYYYSISKTNENESQET
jgi:hypothetical protein